MVEDILNYKIELCGEHYIIRLLGLRFKEVATLIFSDSDVSIKPDTKSFVIPIKQFRDYSETLRNEKPIEFELGQDGKSFVLKTIHEPVGENE